ncbi:hypothetical protein [Devosia sp.]|uniref:hypothetical protein n=1 Tax=Devosia sp. TaxID=1871048 RepID=UPI001ACAC202|nr:hypothetical protein [Devosia sp.]MBN9335286.1 hypothetical protein [Devosia sp.]
MRIPLELETRDDGSMRFPMMRVNLCWQRKGVSVLALVDTGADLLAVDDRVLAALSCPKNGDVHGVRTAHGETDHFRYDIEIEFPAALAPSRIDVTGIDLTGKSYLAILGVPLLELGVLHVDPRGESYFELYADCLAAPPR